jgi:hypothetical protein
MAPIMGDASAAPLINALVKLTESLQLQERKILGVEGRTTNTAASAPAPGASIGGDDLPAGLQDPRTMTQEQLEALLTAAAIFDGSATRPPIPLPPGHGGGA